MAVSLADLHLRVVESISTQPGWRESPFPPSLFPSDPTSFGHQSFAVDIGASRPRGGHEASRGRRPSGVGTFETKLTIRWLFQLPAEEGGNAYRRALAAEAEVQRALSRLAGGPDSDPALHVRLDEAPSRVPAGDGTWLLTTVTATATHPHAFYEA